MTATFASRRLMRSLSGLSQPAAGVLLAACTGGPIVGFGFGRCNELESPANDVEAGRPGDAAAVARLHAHGITEGFLTSLGERFLTYLYSAMAGSPNATLFVSRDEQGTVVGFVAGATSPGAFYREFFRRHGF